MLVYASLNLIAAVEVEDYREMALQMEDGRWFKQRKQVQRLIDRVVKMLPL